jgi:hypothetical protein
MVKPTFHHNPTANIKKSSLIKSTHIPKFNLVNAKWDPKIHLS